MKSKICAMILLFSLNASASSFYEPNHISFKQGFEAGLQALEFQAKQDGYKQRQIEVTKPFLLVYEIKNTPLNEALFLQIIAQKEGFETHLSKEFVSFGEFDREIDAKAKAKELADKFRLEKNSLKVYSKTRSFNTYPFLWQDSYNKLLDDAVGLGVIIQEKVIYKNTPKETKTPKDTKETKPKISTKMIVIKNAKAMSYKSLAGVSDDNLNYTEAGLVNKQEYEFDKEIKTRQGEIFVKVKGRNLYFSNLDVEVSE